MRKPESLPNSQPGSTDPVNFPYGRLQDDVVAGDGSGTPVREDWTNDIYQSLLAILYTASITPNNNPESVISSQLPTAIATIRDAISGSTVLTKLLTVDTDSSGLNANFLQGNNATFYQNADNLNAGTISLDRIPTNLTGKNADQLDGQEGSFYQNADNINAGTLGLDRIPTNLTGKNADQLDGQEGSFYQNADNLNAGTISLDRIPTNLTGKNADQLDGQEGSYYRDASNLNAGTVDPERLDYDPAFPYSLNEFTTYLGIPYRSLQNANTGNQPDTNPSLWEVVGGGGSGQINFISNPLQSSNTTGVTRSSGSIAWSTATPIYGGGAVFFDNLASGQTVDIAMDSVEPAYGGQAWKIDLAYHIENNSTAFVDGEITILLLDGSTEIAGGNLPIVVGSVSRTSVYVYPTTTLTNLKVRIKAGGSGKQCDLRIADLSVSPWNGVSVPAVGGEFATQFSFTGIPGSIDSAASKVQRNNGFLEGTIVFSPSGAATGPITLNIPSGLTLVGGITGDVVAVEAGVGKKYGSLIQSSSTAVSLKRPSDDADYSATVPHTWDGTDKLIVSFKLPISQWSSSIQVSGEDVEYAYNTDTSNADSETAASAGYGPEGVSFGSYTAARRKRVYFRSPLKDSDEFVIQIKISGTSVWTDLIGNEPQTGLSSFLYQNTVAYGIGFIRSGSYEGSNFVTVFFGTYAYASGVYGAAGGAWSGYTAHRWRVVKRSGGSNAEVPPVVRAEYNMTSPQTVGAAYAQINFNNKVEDTHNSVATGASWKFAANTSGIYAIEGMVQSQSFAMTAGRHTEIRLYKNGAFVKVLTNPVTPSVTTYHPANFVGTIRLNTTDYIDLRVYRSDQGSNYTIGNSSTENWVSIERIGS